MAEVHAVEEAVGGKQDYPLDDEDDEEDDEEDEEDEEEDMEKLMEQEEKKKHPDFDEMIDERVRVGNIRLKVHRSIKWVMWRFQAVKKLKALSFGDIA